MFLQVSKSFIWTPFLKVLDPRLGFDLPSSSLEVVNLLAHSKRESSEKMYLSRILVELPRSFGKSSFLA